jgi:hypothetical protein
MIRSKNGVAVATVALLSLGGLMFGSIPAFAEGSTPVVSPASTSAPVDKTKEVKSSPVTSEKVTSTSPLSTPVITAPISTTTTSTKAKPVPTSSVVPSQPTDKTGSQGGSKATAAKLLAVKKVVVEVPILSETYSWLTSLNPGVVTPHGASDVTWPQTLVPNGTEPKCNQAIQIDPYKGTRAQIDAVVSGGVLSLINGVPSDHSVIQPGWTYLVGLTCAPPPVDCVATAGWATEDIAPIQGQYGLIFAGAHDKAVDTYQRANIDANMQGLKGMTYTINAGSHDFVAQMNVEVNPNADLGFGVKHYATLSTINAPITGKIYAQNALWYTSKIAYDKPGGMNDPITWEAMTALMPKNTLISAPSLHLQTSSTPESYSVVSSISSSCGTTNFVPPQPPSESRSDVVVGDPVCSINEDETFPGGGTITTTTSGYQTDYVWDVNTATYVKGAEKLVSGPTDTVTDATLEQCPPTVPPQPDAIVTTAAHSTTDCTTSVVTTTHSTTTIDYKLVDNVWVEQAPVTVQEASTTRPANEVECPVVVVPPTKPPVVTPPGVTPPGVTPPVVKPPVVVPPVVTPVVVTPKVNSLAGPPTAPASHVNLAYTGAPDETPWIVGGIIVILLGALAVAFGYRRKINQHN